MEDGRPRRLMQLPAQAAGQVGSANAITGSIGNVSGYYTLNNILNGGGFGGSGAAASSGGGYFGGISAPTG